MTGDAPSPGQGPGPADESRQGTAAAPLALYRRYRPASFAEVKGQDHVTEPLRQALRSGRINHAYLFSGPRGCGKTSSARILARSLNCEQGPTPDPCGVCASCVALAPSGPGSIDVIEIDAASHGGVDDARDLRERAFYAPVAGRFKIYIIDEAHMVTREGFNALLKLVEEPPPHLKFVFATTEPEKVIATIRSRTHHYPFRLVPPAVLRELLEQILSAEGVTYEPSVLPVVIRAGAGSVRDSLSVLDQLIAGSDESGLSYARAVALLGFTDDRLLDEVVAALAAENGAAVFRAIDRVVEAGHDPRRFAADLLDRLRDLIVLAAVPDAVATGLLEVPADRLEGMQAQASGFGPAELTRAAEIISTGLVEMRGATSPRLLLELMCAQVLLPAPGAGDSDLRGRLERLERRLESGAGAPAASPAAAAVPAPPVAAALATSSSARPPGVGGQAEPRPAAEPSPSGPAPSAGPAPTPSPASRETAPRPSEPGRQASEPAAAAAETAPAPAPAATGPVDAGVLQARWPDVLEAVRGKRKVAWILLTNATVTGLADNVLTVEFAREGDAKGFISSGCDKLLGEILQAMFGISPQLKATARTPGAAPPAARGPAGGSGGPAPSGSGRGSGASVPASSPAPGDPGGAAPGNSAPGNSVPGNSANGAAPNGSAPTGSVPNGVARSDAAASGAGAGAPATPAAGNDSQAGWTDAPPPWDGPPEPWGDPSDDDPDDVVASSAPQAGARMTPPPPPAGPSAMDLIQRELGGRVIEDFGGA